MADVRQKTRVLRIKNLRYGRIEFCYVCFPNFLRVSAPDLWLNSVGNYGFKKIGSIVS